MSTIHIAVACHKPSVLPKNPILVPVQVNAANAKNRMEMAHDDDGVNISYKNPSYCELTAQYWEWKNVSADYYGLCHYRRFLCFTVPKNVKRDPRNHIVAETIDPYNLERFGLEDEGTMRQVIEANDCIVGEYEDIKKLYTPRGKQPTTYKHWVAHDRALIHIEDLDRMLEILEEVNPEVGKDAREYLNKDVFTGFNCFVLRKDLFDELCQIEFEVLERLEKEVDLTNYCTQLSRIYGFMGEIISSSYIYHLEKSGKYKVKHVPILYFNYTDRVAVPTLPADSEQFGANAINVLLYRSMGGAELFGPMLQSLLENISDKHYYNVILLKGGAEIDTAVQAKLLQMAKPYDQVRLQFWNGKQFEKQINERYFSTAKTQKSSDQVPLLPLLPFCLNSFDKLLVFTNNVLLCHSVDELWSTALPENKLIAASLDALTLAQINDIFPENGFDHYSRELSNPYEFHSISAMVYDLSSCRKHFAQDDVISTFRDQKNKIRQEAEAMNVAYEGFFGSLPQEWNVWLPSNDYLKGILPYTPHRIYQELQAAQKAPKLINFQPNDPWIPGTNVLEDLFWSLARKTPFYDFCLLYQTLSGGYAQLKYDFGEMQKSVSFRTGRALTWLPRKIRDFSKKR